MILLSHQHRSVPTIAQLFETNAKTVRYWLKRFNQHGPAGLHDEPRSGRPRKVNPTVAGRLAQLVANDPQQAGYVATFWTVAMLVLSLFQQLGVRLAPGSVRSALHEIGLRWGRPRLTMPLKVDPEKAAKQWALVQAVLAAGPTTVVLYADEARVHLLPILRALWHPVGQQLRIPTPGSNVTRALFGALNLDSGQWVYLVRERMKAADFIVFLEHLLAVYAEDPSC
jgi:transposase